MNVDAERAAQFRQAVLAWAEDNLREFPWRQTDDVYEVFVAEMLLQRTRAETVEPVYGEFIERWGDWDALAAADEAAIAEQIQRLGLHNKRADALRTAAREVVDCGELPRDEESLLEFRRVGRYVANATLCFGCGERRPIVDANVVRVYERVFDVGELNTRSDSVWEFAWEMLPEAVNDVRTYNLALLDLGSLVCTPSSPDCEACPARDACLYAAGEV